MTDRAALLAAVFDRPTDDTPRLVLADQLDDTGEPERAAFIRAHVAACRDENSHPLAAFEQFDRWKTAAIRGQCDPDVWQLTDHWLLPLAGWDRGFLADLRIPGFVWDCYADAFLALHPIRSVHFATPPDPSGFEFSASVSVDGHRLAVDGEAEAVVDPLVTSSRWPGIKFTMRNPAALAPIARTAAALQEAENRAARRKRRRR